jgi:hypothetical protein
VDAGSGSGTYAAIVGSPAVTVTPFTFSPTLVGTPDIAHFTSGGITYDFIATSITYLSQSPEFLNIGGDGIAEATGFADTIGSWTITDTKVGNSDVTFSAAFYVNLPSVPDGGLTAGLLGAALVGVGALRRKLAA